MQNKWFNGALITLVLTALATVSVAEGLGETVSKAAELFDEGEYNSATDLLNTVAGDDRPWADYYLGRIALRREDHDGAIESLVAAVEAKPDSPLFQRWLGEAYIEKLNTVNAFAKLGLAKKAQAHYEEAVRLAPADFDTRDALVGFYLNAPPIAGGSKEKAAAQVEELRALDPAQGNALQGRLHFNQGEWAEAEAAYREALREAAGNADFHYLLGFSQQQQDKHAEAFESFETAIGHDPEALSAYYQIGRTAVFAESNLDRGVECLETYLASDVRRGAPGHEHAWWRLGMLRELRDEKDLARNAYRSALEIDPEHEEAKKALAKLDG